MFRAPSESTPVPAGAVASREQPLGDAVRRLELRGTVGAATAPELTRRAEAALEEGVRWLIADLTDVVEVDETGLAALLAAARALRSGQGELIVAGAARDLAARLAAVAVAQRPVLAATVDEVLVALKLLGPRTEPRPPGQPLIAAVLPRLLPPSDRD